MSSTIGKVRTVRLQVEPVEIELEQDDTIQWTSLQTAFPGCSGMFYNGPTCRTSVKFDGTKFHPPGGAWNDRDYYVSLGSRTMNYPFGSYENASKQFERSVNAVQRMLGGGATSLIDPAHRRSMRSKHHVLPSSHETPPPSLTTVTTVNTVQQHSPPSVPEPRHELEEPTVTKITSSHLASRPTREHSSGSEKSDPMPSIRERESLLRRASHDLAPIEQQFVDLARISTGKDAIIDGQREENRNMKKEMEQLQRDIQKLQAEISSSQKRCIAQEEELSLLRSMSSEQTYMCEKVSTLTQQMLEKDQENARIRGEFAQKVAAMQKEIEELNSTNSTLRSELDEARNKIHDLEVNSVKLSTENSALATEIGPLRRIQETTGITSEDQARALADSVAIRESNEQERAQLREQLDQVRQQQNEVIELSNGMAKENGELLARNRELEERVERYDREVARINETWKETVAEKEGNWQSKEAELQLEVQSSRRELEGVQRMLEAVTRDAAENSKRIEELEYSRDELRRLLDANETRVQEPLKRQIRHLKEQLEESEERVKELNNLVVSLTADARSSAQDMTDFYTKGPV